MEMTLVNLTMVNFLFDAWKHFAMAAWGCCGEWGKPGGVESTLFVSFFVPV